MKLTLVGLLADDCNISQGSVATRLRYGGNFNDHYLEIYCWV